MPRISLTDLADIVSASGLTKVNKVLRVKNRGPYNPAFDFYKPIREGVVAIHQHGEPRESLEELLLGLSDPKKRATYPGLGDGYHKWWGRKEPSWLSPPSKVFTAHGVQVSVNPELGLTWNGHPYIPISSNCISRRKH